MFEKTVVIQNATGLHARPASEFTKFCKKYSNDIKLIFGDMEINPKSIISILAAGLKKGSEVKVQVTGENEIEKCNEVATFLKELED